MNRIKINAKSIEEYLEKYFIKKGKVTGDHYKTKEACMIVSAQYKGCLIAFLPDEYSASDNVGEIYILGRLATTFVKTS
tara:strand:+ start:453 stop:689 length:237 start_codon:yes stop_codon:yes gene_type:complete